MQPGELSDTELYINEECGGDDNDEVPEEMTPAKNSHQKNPWRCCTTFKAHRTDCRKLIQTFGQGTGKMHAP